MEAMQLFKSGVTRVRHLNKNTHHFSKVKRVAYRARGRRTHRKLKFGSPAYRKKYLGHK